MPYKNSEQQAALIHEDLIQTVTHLNDSVNCVSQINSDKIIQITLNQTQRHPKCI